MTCKNLEVGIAISQRPGYFKYYSPNDEIKEIEEKNELARLTKEIKQVQIDIDNVFLYFIIINRLINK